MISLKIKTIFIGKNSFMFDEISSTNDWLLSQDSFCKFSEGTLVVARHQLNGKGQRDSNWFSEKSKSLTFSILLKPHFLFSTHAFDLSICVALAMYDCFQEIKKGFSIKWPNDIFYNNKKVAGILIQNQIRKDHVHNSVIGIGVNVNQEEFFQLPRAISLLHIIGYSISPEKLLARICEMLEVRYLQLRSGKFNVLKEQYISVLYGFNEERFFIANKFKIQGKIIDVHRNGQLKIELVDGHIQTFDMKQITFI